MSEQARKPIIPAAVAALAMLAGCGQTGQLYLPDSQGEVVTRPTQTPPPDSGTTPDSPQSVDSPPVPASPAPEVSGPEDERKDKKNGATNAPPAPTPNN